MASANPTITVAFLASTGKFDRGLSDAQRSLGGFDKKARSTSLGLGTLVKGFAAFEGLRLAKDFLGDSITSASNAQQSLGATQTVFKKYADNVTKDSKRAAQAYGLSANEYRENANLIGSLFKNQGVSSDKLAGKSKQMIGTASDLAATFGGSTKDAVEALGSAFKGEMDPLEKYGISLKQSTVNTEAYKVAHVKTASEFGKLSLAQQTAAKQQATSNLIMKQSADSAGAFGKESDTLAHQQQVLAAQFDNLKVAVGTRLLPILTTVFSYLSTNGPAAFAAIKATVEPFISVISGFFTSLTSGTGTASTKFSQFQTTVSTVFNSVKSIFSSAVTIITSLWSMFGGTIVNSLKTSLTNVMAALRGAFTVIQGLFDVVAGILTGDWKRVWGGLKGVVSGAMAVVKAVISEAWNRITTVIKLAGTVIKSVVSGAFGALKGAASAGVSALVDFVSGIPGKIKGALSGAKTLLYDIGGYIVDGLKRGISDSAHKALSAVTDLGNKVKNGLKGVLEVFSPSKYTRRLGRFVSEGLALGMLDRTPAIVSAVSQTGAKTKKALQKQNVEILKSLRAAAKDRLTALKTQRAEYASAVKDSALSFASLSNLQLGENENLSVSGITQFLNDRLAAVRNFNAKLTQLRAKGISDDLYNQIVQMGVEQGTGYAEVLANATPAAIAQVNNLQAQIGAASTNLGAATAQSMYGAGVAAAEGFYNGLNTLLEKVAKQGTKIGKSLIKSLKKALGIKSPSREMMKLSRFAMEGILKPLDTSVVADRGAALANAFAAGYADSTPAGSVFKPAKVEQISAKALASSGGGATYIDKVEVNVDSKMSPIEYAQQIDKAMTAARKIGAVN